MDNRMRNLVTGQLIWMVEGMVVMDTASQPTASPVVPQSTHEILIEFVVS
jgi:hypothetical protein